MKRKQERQLKQSLILTLLLFAATAAVTGITGLMPKGDISESVEHKTEEPIYEEEVFAVLPEQTTVTVFSDFLSPLTGSISSKYGYRKDPFSGQTKYHKGVDIAVPSGTEVKAAQEGVVTASGYNSVGGNYIVVDHGNDVESYYGHLQTRTVSVGDSVERGQVIGLSGKTGKVTGPHLHFQLIYHNRTVDPERYLDLAS